MRSIALAAIVLVACREPGETPPPPPVPPPYATITIDRPIFFSDVVPSWGGLTFLREGSQSMHVLSSDYFDGRIRYAGCANVCDDSTHWLTATIDSTRDGFFFNSGGALTPSGLHVVYMAFGPAIRHGYCPGACQFPGHWQLGDLFFGSIGNNGPEATPLAADSSGRLHLVYFNNPGLLLYAECGGVCGDSAAWASVRIDSVSAFGYALVTTPGGVNHIVYPTPRLRYATCSTACTDSAHWSSTDIDTSSVNTTALAVAADGRVHVAYLVGDTVHYATCLTSCTTMAGWHSVSLGKRSRAVALSTSGSLVFLATNLMTVDLSQCAADCLNAGSWQSIAVDSAQGGGYLALAVDSAGHAVVASTSTRLQLTHLKQ